MRLSSKKRPTSNQPSLLSSALSIKNHQVYLAKIANVSPIWSRKLPSEPCSGTENLGAVPRPFRTALIRLLEKAFQRLLMVVV